MLVKSFSALAVLAFAAQAIAEPMPYKPKLMKASVRDLFGYVRRQEIPGYQPSSSMCGTGDTCAEACGAGYTTCTSTDDQIHCYNPSANEVCCPDLSGKTCDAGFYCTTDKAGETWCCPNGMDVQACAAAYSISGGLVSQTPKPSSTSSAAPKTTPAKNSTITSGPSYFPTATGGSSGGLHGTNITTGASGTFTPSPTPSKIQQGAGNAIVPAGALALVVAGIAALL